MGPVMNSTYLNKTRTLTLRSSKLTGFRNFWLTFARRESGRVARGRGIIGNSNARKTEGVGEKEVKIQSPK